MSNRRAVSLFASIVMGIAGIATVSTDAYAFRRGVGVGRPGVGRVGVGHVGVRRVAPVRRGVALGAGAAAVGTYHARHCGYYPYPRCY